MLIKAVHQKVDAEHGVIASFPDDFSGYFGWPSVTRMDDGTLIVVASGLRNAHVCPFGRTILCKSYDEGRTWTSPTVINDLPLDDRDAGVVNLGGNSLLVSWFTSDTRQYAAVAANQDARYVAAFRRITDASVAKWLGLWVRRSDDGGDTWGPPVRVPVDAPHGPMRLADGTLLYLGKAFGIGGDGSIEAHRSDDGGLMWHKQGDVLLYPGTTADNYHEPHVVELTDGKLIGLIRVQNYDTAPKLEVLGIPHFSLMQTESEDGGETWSVAQPLGSPAAPLVGCTGGRLRLPSAALWAAGDAQR